MKLNTADVFMLMIIITLFMILGFHIGGYIKKPVDCAELQTQVDSLEIELDSCRAVITKMEKDFNTCYAYKNKAWANNLQSE